MKKKKLIKLLFKQIKNRIFQKVDKFIKHKIIKKYRK
jgi:hypothetical protein